MGQLEYITNITEDQGVAIALIGESVEETGLGFHQYEGDRTLCELFDEDTCSPDGLLWKADDMGSPTFCTTHYYPQEQLGYEFIEDKVFEPTKLLIATQAARLIGEAARLINTALGLMEGEDLNLKNYPEGWADFNEHPGELRDMIITDYADVNVQVGE